MRLDFWLEFGIGRRGEIIKNRDGMGMGDGGWDGMGWDGMGWDGMGDMIDSHIATLL